MTAFVIVLIMLWSMLDTSMLTAYAKDGHNTYNMGIKTIGDGKTVISNTVKYDGKETLYKVENGVEVHISFYCRDCNHVYPNNTTRDGHSFTITDYKCEMTNDGNNLPSFVVTVTTAITSCKGKTYTNTFSAKSDPVECEKTIPTKTFNFTLATGDRNRLVVYLVSPNVPHTGDATCVTQAKCTRCNQQYTGDHNFDTSKWVNAPGENKHYHPCTQEGCTARSSVYTCYTSYSATCMYPAKCYSCFAILEEKNPNNHNNKLVYSSAENDNKITESCGLGCGHTSTATLQIKSDQDLVYTGEPITPMEMVYDSNWVGGQNQPDANCYSNNVEPGEATCTFTYGKATIVKTFTIEKRNYVVDNLIQNMTYDGEPHGITVDAPEGSTIKFMDQDGNYTLDESPKYSECGSYDISYQFSNSRYNTAEVTKTLIINQRPLVVTPDSGQSIIYGGDEPELTYSYSNVAGTEIPGFSGALSISGTDAGQHTITLGTLALKDNGDFKASNYSLELNSTPVSFEIGKASGKIAIPENQTVTYDGEIVTAGLFTGDVKYLYEGDGEVLVKWYADNNGECGEALSEAPYNVGEYWVGVSATDGTNYNATTEVVKKFTISPLDISDDTVIVETIPDQIYSGEAIEPVIHIAYSGSKLVMGTDYTVSYEDNTVTGTGIVTITGIGNFIGNATANFTINKANANIMVDTASYTKTFGDDDFNLGITDSNLETDVVYSSSDEDVVTVSGDGTVSVKNTGTATITLTLPESDNYNEASSKEIEVTVNKAAAPTLADGNKTYTYAESKKNESVEITGIPEDCGAVSYSIDSVTDEENMLENVSVDADGKVTYDVKAFDAYEEGVTATITVNVEMENYETATYELTIGRTDKQVQEISAENISLTYGDEDVVISVIGAKTATSYEVVEDSNANGDVVTVDASGKVSVLNAGTAKIRITAETTDTYAEAVYEITVAVDQLPVSITAESYTVKEKDSLPTFEYKIEGLINVDSLPVEVNVACGAADTNTVGKFDITVSGSESEGNYTYTYVKGVLEILPEDEAPHIVGDNGKMGWDAIDEEILEADKGDEVVVDMNGATVVPSDILEAARDKAIDITFVLDNGLSWTIHGETITSGDLSNINFGTTIESEDNPLNNIPVDVINKVTGEENTIEVNLDYSGEFGFTAVLTTNLESSNAGYYANLFYYNPQAKALEYICSDVIAADGTAKLAFTHASDYIIVIDDVDLGKVKEEEPTTEDVKDDTTQETTGSTTENATTQELAGSMTDTEDATAATSESTTEASANNSNKDSNVATGDDTPIMAIVLVLMFSAIGLVSLSKKKRNA